MNFQAKMHFIYIGKDKQRKTQHEDRCQSFSFCVSDLARLQSLASVSIMQSQVPTSWYQSDELRAAWISCTPSVNSVCLHDWYTHTQTNNSQWIKTFDQSCPKK